MQNKPRAESAHPLPYHLTINDLRDQLFRCSRSKMYELLEDPEMDLPGPVLCVGRDRLWSRDEILAWVVAHRPVERNPRRAAVIEQTRQRASDDAAPQPKGRKAPAESPALALAGFIPASAARRVA